jgi:hypothetical protein
MVPDQNEVENCLKRIESELYNIVHASWNDWLQSTEFGRTRFARTRANIVWDRMIDRALNLLPDLQDVQYIKLPNTVFFIANNTVQFRFKKGDAKGLSSNYPTPQAIAYHDHEQILLPFLKDLIRVEIVYLLNKTESYVENVFVVARNRNNIAWHYNIFGTAKIENFPKTEKQKTEIADLLRFHNNDEEKKSKRKGD